MNITLQPNVLKWARERAGLDAAALAKKLSTTAEKVIDWEAEGTLTYKRAEKLADKTHTPFGYLFLDEPPVESLPITDFRTVGSEEPSRPSPELLDVLYDAMSKQAWYRDYLIEMGEDRHPYIGSVGIKQSTASVAQRISHSFSFESEARAQARDWKEALNLMFEQCEDMGVLVTRTGMAKGNTHRPLKVEEFRFAAIQAKQKSSGGGNYYASKNVQVGRRFARALIGSTLEGRTPYREAYSLLGVKKTETFNNFARQLHFRV